MSFGAVEEVIEYLAIDYKRTEEAAKNEVEKLNNSNSATIAIKLEKDNG